MGVTHTGSLCLPDGATVHVASASWITAVTVGLHLFDGLSGLGLILMQDAVLVLDTSLLQWESMEALVVSSCPVAAFISLCSQSTFL